MGRGGFSLPIASIFALQRASKLTSTHREIFFAYKKSVLKNLTFTKARLRGISQDKLGDHYLNCRIQAEDTEKEVKGTRLRGKGSTLI